jgi:predicted TIM-barrel fold metal-dependent hydrolase
MTEAMVMERPAEDIFTGMKIVDVDTHFSEPLDLWTSRAPAKFKDRMPRMIRQADGKPLWVIESDTSLGHRSAASVVQKDGSKNRGTEFLTQTQDEVHASSYSVKERLAYMDEAGIWAQILYPNVLGFAGQRAAQVDPELRLLATQIYNDVTAEMQADSGERLLPMALLPWWDIKLAVAEAERCHNMGMRGVNINSEPHHHGMQPLHGDYWTPLWDFCSDKGLPINFHIGASDASMTWYGDSPWPGLDESYRLALGSTMMFFSNAKVIANLIYSGLLEKFPRLNFVSVESGIGWIPFVLEALDYEYIEAGADRLNPLSMKPSDYFRRQIYACFWFEQEDIANTIRRVGVDNVMFETDFPHPTCLYPTPLDVGRSSMALFTPTERKKIMSGNAARIYNLDL